MLCHRHLIYIRWCIPHCGQEKIEAKSQALVVPTELTRSMIICVFCIAEMGKVDKKNSFMQLESILIKYKTIDTPKIDNILKIYFDVSTKL